jgi:hypothetical protein
MLVLQTIHAALSVCAPAQRAFNGVYQEVIVKPLNKLPNARKHRIRNKNWRYPNKLKPNDECLSEVLQFLFRPYPRVGGRRMKCLLLMAERLT